MILGSFWYESSIFLNFTNWSDFLVIFSFGVFRVTMYQFERGLSFFDPTLCFTNGSNFKTPYFLFKLFNVAIPVSSGFKDSLIVFIDVSSTFIRNLLDKKLDSFKSLD